METDRFKVNPVVSHAGNDDQTDWGNVISSSVDSLSGMFAAIFRKTPETVTYNMPEDDDKDDDKSDNTVLYVGIGAGALVLVVLLVVLLK